MDYKFASWMMSERCNFDCSYCHTHRPDKEKSLVDVNDLVKTLTQAYPKWTVGMTGGEPFLYPEFLKVCQILVAAGFKIAIDTNLSTTPLIKEFANLIPSKRVDYIYSSVHVTERERIYRTLDLYIRNVLELKTRGFPVQVSYVMHPPLFARFNTDFDYFKKYGLSIEPKPFNGIYRGKLYPGAYLESEKRFILKYNPDAFKKTPFYSKNLRCRTGMDLVRVWPDGTIGRCVAVRVPLGNVKNGLKLLTDPKPCEVGWCPCFGWEYVTDKITKNRLKQDLRDTKISLWDVAKTPRVWRKGVLKLRRKGMKAIFDYV